MAASKRKVALVLGNSRYAHEALLPNAVHDATSVAKCLSDLEFNVTLETDVGRTRLAGVLSDFSEHAVGSDIALIYFAGHGIDVDGDPYLLPIDCDLSHVKRVSFEAQPLKSLQLAVAGARELGLIVLDACRSNPYRAKMRGVDNTRGVLGGFSPVEPQGNVLVAYAAKHGTLAADGKDDQHSPFTSAFLEFVQQPNLDVRLLFGKIRDAVLTRTGGLQEPHIYGSLGGSEVSLNYTRSTAFGSVFVSYNHEDREKIEQIAALLELRGWNVFWDQNLITGEDWEDVIERKLIAADCIVVVWSKYSVKSDWVKHEASRGRDYGVLVPVSLDGASPPKLFKSIHTVSLSGWDGSPSSAGFVKLIQGIERTISVKTERRKKEISANIDSGRAKHTRSEERLSQRPPWGKRMLWAGGAWAACSGLAWATVALFPQITVNLGSQQSAPTLIQQPYQGPAPRAPAPIEAVVTPSPPTPAAAVPVAPQPAAPVRITRDSRDLNRAGTTTTGLTFAIVASLESLENAKQLVGDVRTRGKEKLAGRQLGIRIFNNNGRMFYRVVVEPASDRRTADATCNSLKTIGFTSCFVASLDVE